MKQSPRLSTGVDGLDALLGGGLLPGTLTVVMGATGIGKTQLGLEFANAGESRDGTRGIVFDMSSRGDSQQHAHYAERLFGWRLSAGEPLRWRVGDDFFEHLDELGDYLHVFETHGRRVTRGELGFDEWQDWQAELSRKLQASIGFLYGNFVRGVRRLVVDGVEPAERASDSIQLELFEYIYHQILRKDADWVARDLFRERYSANAERVAKADYRVGDLACLLLYTSSESMLDSLIERELDEGDVLANANTIIYLGKIREANRLLRALYVAKHRGSACSDEIVPYTIDDHGLRVG